MQSTFSSRYKYPSSCSTLKPLNHFEFSSFVCRCYWFQALPWQHFILCRTGSHLSIFHLPAHPYIFILALRVYSNNWDFSFIQSIVVDDDITWFISALPSRETAPMHTQQWCLLMLSFIDQRLHRSSINACASAPFPRPPPWQFSPPNCTTRPTFVTACAEMNCRV